MNKKDFIKTFLAGCFSMSFVPSEINVPELPEVTKVNPLNSQSVWAGVSGCFKDAGVLISNSAKQLTNV